MGMDLSSVDNVLEASEELHRRRWHTRRYVMPAMSATRNSAPMTIPTMEPAGRAVARCAEEVGAVMLSGLRILFVISILVFNSLLSIVHVS